MRISGITYVARKTHKVRNFFLTLLFLILAAALAAEIASAFFGLDLEAYALELLDMLYSWLDKLESSLTVFN